MTTKDLRDFRKSTNNRYIVETSRFYSRKGKTIPEGIYGLFGEFCESNADETRERLVSWANERREEISEAGTVILKHDDKDYSWWILTMTHKKNPVDELALWCLCKMTYRHAVVYTLDHTWTTLKNKNMTVEEINKVCDLHFAYMGYGKFASIMPVDHTVTSTNVLPTMQTLTTRKGLTTEIKTPISRNHHGQHPSGTVSAHIDYFNLNQGQGPSERKSPRVRRRKTTTKLTLREPTPARIAAQTHIHQEKEQRGKLETVDDELTVIDTLPPDEDGTAFTRPSAHSGTVIGSAVKIEPMLHPEMDEQHELDEPPMNVKQEPSDNKHEKDEQTTSTVSKTETDTQTKQQDDIVVEKVLYTHAHGHTCTRKDCTPIIISKRGVIKPNQPSTGHFHLSNICDKGGNTLETPKLEPPTLKTESTETLVPEKDERPTTVPVTDIPESTVTISDNKTKTAPTALVPETSHEMDEQLREAVGGLLLLQELCNTDPPQLENLDNNSELMPIAKPTNVQEDLVPEHKEDEQLQGDDNSDNTIIYDPLTSETPPKETTQHAAATELSPRKGTLTIREVSLRKPGTSTDKSEPTPANDNDAMPVITTSGKVRCDFCKRSFNTLAEQKQHMVCRHHAQLAEKEAKRKREKDEQEKQELAKKEASTKADKERDHARNRKRKPEKDEQSDDTKKKRDREMDKRDTTIKGTKVHTKETTKRRKTSPPGERKYSCNQSNCKQSYSSQSELNRHHKDRHPPIQCSICKQLCSTPNTLDRHMYKHKERKLSCQYCKEKFAFKSELEMHMSKHQGEPSFYCKQCTKAFMRIGDLREHEETHTKKTHYCPKAGCTYSAKLKRYVRVYVQTMHADKEDLPYPCKKKGCKCSFKFYEQRKRHYNNDH